MTIKIKKETIKMIQDWDKLKKDYGLSLTDQRIISKLKKLKKESGI